MNKFIVYRLVEFKNNSFFASCVLYYKVSVFLIPVKYFENMYLIFYRLLWKLEVVTLKSDHNDLENHFLLKYNIICY